MTSTMPPIDQPATTRTIDQLCLSPFNVRTDAVAISAEKIAHMEKLLLSQGQLEPILVHPLKGNVKKWGAHAGGRRYRAFVNLIERGDLPRDWPIKVEIKEGRTEAELIEESMVENIGRTDLKPYETFAGVRRAHALGHSVDRIAHAIGQDAATIARMLRLGNLAKPIFDALSAGRISTDQARAFGATEDTAVQLGTWQRLSAGLASFTPSAERIRAAIGIGDQQLGKLLTFVGEDAYVAAGGRIEPDLFATAPDERGRIVDPGKLHELAEAMIDVLRADVRRHTGRPDLRFVSTPPEAMGTTDHQLQIHARSDGAGKIPLPDGDVVARIYVDANGKAVVQYWWASRSAKYARERGDRAPAASSPAAADVAAKAEALRPAAAIGQQYDGARQVADAALRQEDGLSAESVQIFRSVRRAILRGMLVDDALEGGEAGLDYLVWTQLRLAMDMDARPSKLGIAGKTGAEADPEFAREHVQAMPAHAQWCEGLKELRSQTFVTGEDLSEAFADYRASSGRLKILAAAVVAGWSLERSLAADGYVVPVHDELARQVGVAGFNHDDVVRGYWKPTEALLARIPTRQALTIAEPFVEPEVVGRHNSSLQPLANGGLALAHDPTKCGL